MIAIIFDTPPGPESQFVEVERDGKGVKFGEWKQHGEYWHLELVEVDNLEEQLELSNKVVDALTEELSKTIGVLGVLKILESV